MMLLTFLGLIPALFSMAGQASPQQQPQGVRRVVINEEVIISIPIRPRQSQRVDWIEQKGPKCIRTNRIAGTTLSGPSSIDFLLRDRQRVRAIMDNPNETLWPGTLVNTKLNVRIEDAVVVPSVAIQRSQTGMFVFMVKDGKAAVQPVTVSRTFQGLSVIEKGLSGGEVVVTDGQMQLLPGTAVNIAERKAGA